MKAEDQQQEYERIAYEAATQAIRESFKMIFGIDVNDRQDVADLRDDLMRMRRMRRIGDRIGIAALIAMTTMVVSGAVSFLWSAIKSAARQ